MDTGDSIDMNTENKKIILASASPRRHELLREMGVPYEVLVTDADESAIGVINNKTTAVRLIPVWGKDVGDSISFGGLWGEAPIMPVHRESPAKFIGRGGRVVGEVAKPHPESQHTSARFADGGPGRHHFVGLKGHPLPSVF